MSAAFGSTVNNAEVNPAKALGGLAGQLGQSSPNPRSFQTLVETVVSLFDGSLAEIWERERDNGGLSKGVRHDARSLATDQADL